jgi:hypothetical protein
MTHFFDPEHFKRRPYDESKCWGCDKPWEECSPTLDGIQALWEFIGILWPGGDYVAVNIGRDFRTLGLGPASVPQMLPLCVTCASPT